MKTVWKEIQISEAVLVNTNTAITLSNKQAPVPAIHGENKHLIYSLVCLQVDSVLVAGLHILGCSMWLPSLGQ